MTPLDALKDLKLYIQKSLTDANYTLQKEESTDMVVPYVEICYLPHKNFTPTGFQTPGVLICFDEARDTGKERTMGVRILCSTYGGGYYDGTTIPDAKGYEDLLNLLEWLQTVLLTKQTIGRASITRPIECGIYDTELSWPYWYGYVSFDVPLTVVEYPLSDDMQQEIDKFLYGQ